MTDLSDKAATVAENAAAHQAAKLAERTAHAEALKKAIDEVVPALDAMSSMIEHTTRGAPRMAGVCLDRTLGHAKIVLSVNGAPFAEGIHDWDRITYAEAVARAPVADMIRALHDALDRQLRGKLKQRTEEINERAARLRAILAVL